MKYYTIPPPPEIADYVRFFWVLESGASDDNPYTHRSLADACCEMVFHYKGRFNDVLADGSTPASAYSGVSGPTRKFSRFSISEDFGIFGAYLYPFVIPYLFGMPTDALTDSLPDLPTVLGQPGQDLEEEIITAADNSDRVKKLTNFILNRLKSGKQTRTPVVSAILHIVNSMSPINVNELSDQCYLSTRQFERNFKLYAGFTPKLYSRIIRFQLATRQYTGVKKSLTEIAYDCGYYDQSHFIHDFKEFSGYHPRHYFSGNNEGTGWKDV